MKALIVFLIVFVIVVSILVSIDSILLQRIGLNDTLLSINTSRNLIQGEFK
jgi:hypothetical protein